MLVHKNRVKEIMKRNGVDVLVASMPENVTYLTDFWSLSHWLLKGTQTYAVIPADEKIAPYIVTSLSDLDMAAISEANLAASEPVKRAIEILQFVAPALDDYLPVVTETR